MIVEKICNDTDCKYCKLPESESCKTRINNEFYISIDSSELSVLYDRIIEGNKKSKNSIWKFTYMSLANCILALKYLILRYEESKGEINEKIFQFENDNKKQIEKIYPESLKEFSMDKPQVIDPSNLKLKINLK